MAKLNIMKISFYISNFLFLIFACVLMAVGSYAINQQSVTSVSIPAGITALGAILLLATIFGVFAACKESQANKLLLSVYMIIIGVLIVILLFVGVAVAVKKDAAPTYVLEGFKGLNNAGKLDIQAVQQCCGALDYNDTLAGQPCPDMARYPLSNRPCVPILVSEFNSIFNTAGVCGIVFAVIMLIGFFISGFLLFKAREGYNQSVYKTHEDAGLQSDAL